MLEEEGLTRRDKLIDDVDHNLPKHLSLMRCFTNIT